MEIMTIRLPMSVVRIMSTIKLYREARTSFDLLLFTQEILIILWQKDIVPEGFLSVYFFLCVLRNLFLKSIIKFGFLLLLPYTYSRNPGGKKERRENH